MTKIIVIGLSFSVAVIDVSLLMSGSVTISEYLYTTSKDNPILAVIAGVLIGHIFWPVKSVRK